MQQSSVELSARAAQIVRPEPGTIAICVVAAALEAVRARQMDADELLVKIGLSPSLLQVPQARAKLFDRFCHPHGRSNPL